MRLPRCGARAYLVQDAEPEFYAAAAERDWAQETYRLGLFGIAASPWLAEMVRAEGSPCGHFDLAVDHDSTPRRRRARARHGRVLRAL